jgi:hypothetical protein
MTPRHSHYVSFLKTQVPLYAGSMRSMRHFGTVPESEYG